MTPPRAPSWAAIVLSLAAMAPASAESRERLLLEVGVRSLTSDGSTNARAMDTSDAGAGVPDTNYFHAGLVSDPPGTICSLGGSEPGAANIDELVAQHQHVWRITTRPLAQADGRVTFDLEWDYYNGSRGRQPASSDRRRLTLLEGQRHVISVLHATASACPSVSIVVDVGVRARENPRLADRSIQYDLWLVHTTPAGERRTRHLVNTALQGLQIPFAFAPVRLPLPPPNPDFELASRVGGSVRGRIQEDGQIEVELVANRREDVEGSDGPVPNRLEGGEGRKVLLLRSGEAVQIDLPAPSGGWIRPAGAGGGAPAGAAVAGARAAPAQTPVAGGDRAVSFATVLQGHKLAILLRARSVD